MNRQLGATLQRLRKAYRLSLGELSEQSGVAKSIISRIEKNETNPTIATMQKLCTALDRPLADLLSESDQAGQAPPQVQGFVEKTPQAQTPILISEDKKCTLRILGWIRAVELVQWYDVVMQAQGLIASEGHPSGSVENITVLAGTVQLEIDDDVLCLNQGETARYRADRPHLLRNMSHGDSHLTMVNLLPPVAKLAEINY